MHPTAVVSVVLKHMSLFLFHLGGILQLIFGKSVTASFLLFDLYSLLFWFIAFFFPIHTFLVEFYLVHVYPLFAFCLYFFFSCYAFLFSRDICFSG